MKKKIDTPPKVLNVEKEKMKTQEKNVPFVTQYKDDVEDTDNVQNIFYESNNEYGGVIEYYYIRYVSQQVEYYFKSPPKHAFSSVHENNNESRTKNKLTEINKTTVKTMQKVTIIVTKKRTRMIRAVYTTNQKMKYD